MKRGFISARLRNETEHELSTNLKKKVALFCNVDENAVVQSMDMPTIYEVPVRMQEQGLDVTILQKMGLPVGETPTLGPEGFHRPSSQSY